MTSSIVLAVLFAAMLHAVWNSLAHAIHDRLVGFAMIGLVDAVGGGALAACGGLPPAQRGRSSSPPRWCMGCTTSCCWPVISSASSVRCIHWPRGTSPWVVALLSLVLLGRALPLTELAGVLAVSAGLIGLVLIGGRPGRKDVPALAAALLTGLMISAYTVIDGVGVTHAPLLAYAGWLFLLQAPSIVIIALIRRRRQFLLRCVPARCPAWLAAPSR